MAAVAKLTQGKEEGADAHAAAYKTSYERLNFYYFLGSSISSFQILPI